MLQIRTGQCCRRALLSARQWSDRCQSHDSAVAHMTKRITHSSPLPQSYIATTNPAADRRIFSFVRSVLKTRRWLIKPDHACMFVAPPHPDVTFSLMHLRGTSVTSAADTPEGCPYINSRRGHSSYKNISKITDRRFRRSLKTTTYIILKVTSASHWREQFETGFSWSFVSIYVCIVLR